jgi:hypothetical protein
MTAVACDSTHRRGRRLESREAEEKAGDGEGGLGPKTWRSTLRQAQGKLVGAKTLAERVPRCMSIGADQVTTPPRDNDQYSQFFREIVTGTGLRTISRTGEVFWT